jgi:hypothetical protein
MVVVGNIKQVAVLLIVLWPEGEGRTQHNWLATDFGHTDYSFRGIWYANSKNWKKPGFWSIQSVSGHPRLLRLQNA